MPDNWAYVIAAYGLTALVLGLYWRHLVRRETELRGVTTAGSKTADAKPGSARSVAGASTAHVERARESSISDREIAEPSRLGEIAEPSRPGEIAERSRPPSRSGHPRPDPSTRGPLQ